MEGAKTKVIIVALVVIIIIVASIGFYLVMNRTLRINVMDAKAIADEVALSYNDSAQLYYLSCQNVYINNDGSCGEWWFHYRVGYNQKVGNMSVQIIVFWDGTHNGGFTCPDHCGDILNESISNWTIDNYQALDIALDNSEVKSFIDTNDAKLWFYLLQVDSDYSTNPVWKIKWTESGVDAKNIWVIIDSNTGEVLNIETNN